MSDTTYKSKVGYKPPVELDYHEGMPEIKSVKILDQVEEYVVAQCSAAVGVKIEREELIKALQYDRGQYEKGYADGSRDAAEALQEKSDVLIFKLEEAAEMLRQMPKRGKWIPIQIGKWRGHKCSCCGIAREVPCSSSDGIPQWKYCPECGAKMEAKE